jgi:hypothetical protein
MTHFLIITNTAELDKNKQIFKENFMLKPKLVKLTNNNILNNKIQLLNAEILSLCAIVNDITVKLNGPFNEKTNCTDIGGPKNKNINNFSKACALARIQESYNNYKGYIDSKNILSYKITNIDEASYSMIRNIVKNNYSSLIFKKKDLTKLQSKIGNNKSKFVISNSANLSTDWYAPYLYCPIVSTFDSMTTCGYDTTDFSIRNGMNLKIQTRDDKISYFVQFLKNENQPNHYLLNAILTYNNAKYDFGEDLNISNYLSRFDAKNAFHELVINMHNVYKKSPEKIQNVKGSSPIYTKYTEFFDFCNKIIFKQAFYKSIGDWGQEIHVLSKNGGFIPDKNNEIQNIRGFDNSGDFIRIGIAEDRPSASRMMFMCLFADNINNDVIVGYQHDDTSRFAPNTGDYTKSTKDLLISRKPFFPDEDTGHYTDYEETDYEETDYEETDMEDNDSISIQDDVIDLTSDVDYSMDVDSQQGITDVDSEEEYIRRPRNNTNKKKVVRANREVKNTTKKIRPNNREPVREKSTIENLLSKPPQPPVQNINNKPPQPPVQNINNKPPQPPVQNINNKPPQPSNKKTIKNKKDVVKATREVKNITKKVIPLTQHYKKPKKYDEDDSDDDSETTEQLKARLKELEEQEERARIKERELKVLQLLKENGMNIPMEYVNNLKLNFRTENMRGINDIELTNRHYLTLLYKYFKGMQEDRKHLLIKEVNRVVNLIAERKTQKKPKRSFKELDEISGRGGTKKKKGSKKKQTKKKYSQ